MHHRDVELKATENKGAKGYFIPPRGNSLIRGCAAVQSIVFVLSVLNKILGTLRFEDGNGGENVAEKVNSRSFNLHSDYSKSPTLANVGEPS